MIFLPSQEAGAGGLFSWAVIDVQYQVIAELHYPLLICLGSFWQGLKDSRDVPFVLCWIWKEKTLGSQFCMKNTITVLYMLFQLHVMFLLWTIYRWIYIMQIKVFISKCSDVIFWKPGYFDVECTWTPAILMPDSWRISLLLPGLILLVSKCAGEEIPAEQDFEIINVCKSQVAFFLSRVWNGAQYRFFSISWRSW